ncbi:hypothetical protein [Bacteroides sp.]|uniref:hypothetical protein n=1 Tax=Bacteroides sp. TaxID=29523 RepID=UPI00260DC35C|nr:hypothetical protein [Bacteroides sp.]MDD3038908.1 hypothetical protein [Bacteroides sp.]
MKTTTSIALPKQSGAKSALKSWLRSENLILSYFAEQSVSNANALRITHAVIAFVFLIFTPSAGAIAALICLVWFIATILICKKGGLK